MDPPEAVRLFRLAVDQGYAEAQLLLGGCYEHGTGVVKDTQQAIKLYELSSQQGNRDARQALETLNC